MRHGRTAWNEQGRFAGSSDVPLDEVGYAQAAALAERLAHEHFDLAASSDLQRARATAEAIARASGVDVRTDPRLREMRFGAWEGLTWAEIARRWKPMETRTADWQAPGGESIADVRRRVEPALRSLTQVAKPCDHVLIVSHAAVMHAILQLMLRDSQEAFSELQLAPGSLIQLRGQYGGEWAIESIERPEPD